MSNADRLKQAAAEFAAAQVEDGMKVGLGTGSTVYFLIEALGKRVAQGLRMVGVPTSVRTATQAKGLGISLSDLGAQPRLDLTIDGADEVESGSLNLLKGLGGALLREKIVAAASSRLMIIVDETKVVAKLGAASVIPVEVAAFGWPSTERKLKALGCIPKLRTIATGETFVTDGGNYILDCGFGPVPDVERLDRDMNSVIGVVEHGLFLGMTSVAVVGRAEGVETLLPTSIGR
jgi:ribose 5-phosphate isomerase A